MSQKIKNNIPYFKLRIIVTFCAVNILLVAVLSFWSYSFIKKIYLGQISEQAVLLAGTAGGGIEAGYLDLLQLGEPRGTLRNYFTDNLVPFKQSGAIAEIFIFDSSFRIIINPGNSSKEGNVEPRLLLNRNEIAKLPPKKTIASLPFKGDDGKWYMWGFFRLDRNYCLAVRENASRLEKVESFSDFFIIAGLAGVIVTFLGGWFIASGISKPVNKLISFSSEIGKGNLDCPVPPGISGELGQLSSALEKMRDDIKLSQKEKENILAQIAHEIRNPLGGIELMASLIKEDIQSEGKHAEYVGKILKEVAGLKTLISAYLNYSRPVKPVPTDVKTEELLGEIRGLFDPVFSEKGISLDVENNLNEIIFDAMHLRQILINLIANALDARRETGGSIVITTGRLAKSVYISVCDNGLPFMDGNTSPVFEPFYTTKKDGTGLGLAICRKLAHENDAEIKIEIKNNLKIFTISKEVLSV